MLFFVFQYKDRFVESFLEELHNTDFAIFFIPDFAANFSNSASQFVN